jgi:hypothetical protein
VATVSTGAACPVAPESAWGRLSRKLNTVWHERALRLFMVIVLLHWGEHLVQTFQVYILGWPLKESFGLLGMLWPWMVKSEALHYAYAIVMLVGLWVFRKGFTGRAYVWWMIAFWIQFWHHIEHALLLGQVVYGANFCGAPGPISLIQMLGLIEGPGSTGFNGMMVGPPRHPITALLFAVRRLEVHMIYNTIVFIPMVVGMYYHLFPTPEEEQHMTCSCAWHRQSA